MAQGFVYILVSPNSNNVKIGGTERPISERLRDINGTSPYSDHGPWELSDFLYVTDWRLVEGEMHRHFQSNAVRNVTGTRELFSIPPHEARTRLALTNSSLRIDHERTEQIFSNRDVKLYLFRLFELSGLFGNVDIQGAWTLTLLPKTNGGRWFTLNKILARTRSHLVRRKSLTARYRTSLSWTDLSLNIQRRSFGLASVMAQSMSPNM
jgi:hypothetical protein